MTPQEIKALNYSEKVDLVYLERDIRRSKVPLSSSALTQAGSVVTNYIDGVNFCSVDLSSLHSLEFPGASLPSPACGLKINEMEEIMRLNGIKKVKVISLSEYNPAIEKFQSGEVICKLI